MINKVIFSTTDDPYYKDFAIHTARAWKKLLPSCDVLIGYINPNAIEAKVVECHPDFDDFAVFEFPTMDGIPDGNFAKVLRTIIATSFPNQYCLIADVDMLPLNGEYFTDNSNQVNEENIVFYTSELEGEDAGKFPICYMLASGRVWGRLVNPNELPIHILLQSWCGTGDMIDPSRMPFSDESLYREIFRKNGQFVNKINLTRHHQEGRICRSDWNYDKKKLAENGYIDSHLPRPLITNLDKINPLFEHVGIPTVRTPEPYE